MTVLPADPSNFKGVIATADPGDTVELAGGVYPGLFLSNVGKEAPGVLVRPAPETHVLFPGIEGRDCAGLTFSGLAVGPNPKTRNALASLRCERFVFEGLKVGGDPAAADGGRAGGAFIRGSQHVIVHGCEFANLSTGIAHIDSEHVTIDGNTLHDLRGGVDGIRGISSHLRITNNLGYNFFNQGTFHSDFIQLWTVNLTESPHDIHIEGNEFRVMEGSSPQGIFCGQESGLPYLRLVIRDNCINGSSYNGILVNNGVEALLEDNVLVGFDNVTNASTGKLITPWVALRACGSGTIRRNIAPLVNLIQSTGVTVEDNTIIEVARPGDYSIADAWRQRRAGSCSEQIKGRYFDPHWPQPPAETEERRTLLLDLLARGAVKAIAADAELRAQAF